MNACFVALKSEYGDKRPKVAVLPSAQFDRLQKVCRASQRILLTGPTAVSENCLIWLSESPCLRKGGMGTPGLNIIAVLSINISVAV